MIVAPLYSCILSFRGACILSSGGMRGGRHFSNQRRCLRNSESGIGSPPHAIPRVVATIIERHIANMQTSAPRGNSSAHHNLNLASRIRAADSSKHIQAEAANSAVGRVAPPINARSGVSTNGDTASHNPTTVHASTFKTL